MDHKDKFQNFIKMCATEKADCVIIANLWVIGDTIEEVETNMAIAGKFGKKILITEPNVIVTINQEITIQRK